MRQRRGYVLFFTIVMGMIIFAMLIIAAPGTELSRLQLGRERRAEASSAARSVEAAAMSSLIYQPDFGVNTTISWTPNNTTTGYQGNLTFIRNADGPYSTSNVNGTNPVTGYQSRQVPPYQVHLAGLGVSRRTKVCQQSLVRPFRQVMVEDFNADGEGSTPRLPWVYFPQTTGHLCQSNYMFLGSPTYRQNVAQWMMLPGPRWRDYQVQAHVAYYGTTSFGFSLRTSSGWEGYRLELQPVIGLETINGIDATVTAVVGGGETTIPFPDTAQHIDDPVFNVGTDLSTQPAVWTLAVTIQKQTLTLGVWDPDKQDFRTVGNSFDLSKLGDGLRTAGYPPSFDEGGVGVWAQTDTGIGVTNLVVKMGGDALLRTEARWDD